ncbi:MAG: hypothetical protein RL711_403 [Bacteroidota bacterium]|jgi:hypothetical protein
MAILNSIITWVMKKRIHQMELFMKYPIDVQNDLLKQLLQSASQTEWGKKYGYSSVDNLRIFKERVPITSYEELFPYIERIMKGEQNILWSSKVTWFAKSSGTTNARSKFIPITQESLEDCHFKGGKDMLSIYVNNYPETQIFDGKGLTIGGSHQINHLNPDSFYGDVSAVIMQNLPFWAQIIRTPKLEIALMDKWEDKIAKMVETTVDENVTSLSGVPTWTIVLIQQILAATGKKTILDIWPNLEVFVHGAVSFNPYRQLFKELIPSPDMRYMETYNASEGFFGIQDQSNSEDLLLMLDYGIFYEFIPMENIDQIQPETLTLAQVTLGKNYALVISTNAGLWRYMIGDTVKFTSLHPFRIRISGRTKHFINAFGEEVVVENADTAITKACKATGAIISDYTAGPIYVQNKTQGAHEWIIEFEKEPSDMAYFSEVLDLTLREINSDYDAKRYKNMALQAPLVHLAPKGTFYHWMKGRGKLGGQHKVPRLSNDRSYLDDILKLL